MNEEALSRSSTLYYKSSESSPFKTMFRSNRVKSHPKLVYQNPSYIPTIIHIIIKK